MGKSSTKRKPPRRRSEGTGPPPTGRRKPPEATRVVAWTAAAAIASAVIGVAFLTPLLVCAPYVYLTWKTKNYSFGISLRWAASLLIAVLVAMVFIPARTVAALPFGAAAKIQAVAWLQSGSAAPAGWAYLVAGVVSFAVLAGLSGGSVGALLLSIGIGRAAVVASTLYAAGNNVIQITLVALPPWLYPAIGACLCASRPLSVWSRSRLLRRPADEPDPKKIRRDVWIAAALFVLALLLRLVLTGPYTSLVRHWTIY